MVSIPLYLLRKLENHPITEAFQVGLELLQERANSNSTEQLQVKMKRKEEDLIKTTQENIELLGKLEDSADSNKQLKERNKSLSNELGRMLK